VPDWEERITSQTRPSIRVEHDARYVLAAPVVRDSALWADLGCGSGIAAATALDGAFGGRAVLVDLAPEALAQARRELDVADTVELEADLSDHEAVARVRSALLEDPPTGARTVTSFETIEHLANFVPFVELLSELAEQHAFTVLVSVPNDAFWSIENPYHQTMWGEGAFEELRRLLPEPLALVRQVPLTGSALVVDGAPQTLALGSVEIAEDRVPSHMIAAFGPRAGEVASLARTYAADLDGQRRWERQRESDLAVLQARAAQFEEWLRYRDELEERLEEANARLAAEQARAGTAPT
jgi:SAM-dependent methyltransferase